MPKALTHPKKGKKLSVITKGWGADIILVQETRFSTFKHPQFFDKSYSQFHCTTYNSKSRGTSIFIKNSVVFETHSVFKDSGSRYIILKGTIKGRMITVASVYASN